MIRRSKEVLTVDCNVERAALHFAGERGYNRIQKHKRISVYIVVLCETKRDDIWDRILLILIGHQ